MVGQKRRRYSVSVDVDICDVLAELDDEELIAECQNRNILAASGKIQAGGELTPVQAWEMFANDIRRAFRERDQTHLDVILERAAPPCPPPRKVT